MKTKYVVWLFKPVVVNVGLLKWPIISFVKCRLGFYFFYLFMKTVALSLCICSICEFCEIFILYSIFSSEDICCELASNR